MQQTRSHQKARAASKALREEAKVHEPGPAEDQNHDLAGYPTEFLSAVIRAANREKVLRELATEALINARRAKAARAYPIRSEDEVAEAVVVAPSKHAVIAGKAPKRQKT